MCSDRDIWRAIARVPPPVASRPSNSPSRAFEGFSEARRKAGVRSYTIRQPVDDPGYLTLDLEFDTSGQAEAFAGFLHGHVWSSAPSSPALAGTPQTRILELRQSQDGG